MSQMEEALKLIIARSAYAAHQAMACLQAISKNSPIVAQRYANVVQMALYDSQANWTSDERAILAAPLSTGAGTETRTVTIAVRLTEAERNALQDAADQANQSISDYIRSRLF